MIVGAPVRHVFMRGIVWYLNKTCHVLEIGSYRGASALTWHEAGCNVLCLDPWVEYEGSPDMEQAYADFLYNTRDSAIHHIKGSSREMLPQLRREYFDIVYIDGDHRYDAVRYDIENAMPLIKDGGIICGDDLNIQLCNCDGDFAEKYLRLPFMKDLITGRGIHPGVTVAVSQIFGEVSMWGGFWAMQRHGNIWKKISLRGMPFEYPKHFPQDKIMEAKKHLADIEI